MQIDHNQSKTQSAEKGLLALLNEEQLKASALCLPPHLKILAVTGDTMKPTFREGDFVIIDTQQKQSCDGYFALNYGGGIAIKKLQFLLDGGVQISTDNQLYSDETVADAEHIKTSLVGRIIFVEKRLY